MLWCFCVVILQNAQESNLRLGWSPSLGAVEFLLVIRAVLFDESNKSVLLQSNDKPTGKPYNVCHGVILFTATTPRQRGRKFSDGHLNKMVRDAGR